MEVNFNVAFNEDSIIKLQKDLNHLLTHLNSQNVKQLYTEYCEIESEEGTMILDGPIVEMYGQPETTNSTTLRLLMGWDSTKRSSTGTNKFIFSLFNELGDKTIELDSCGNAIFSGDIDTAEDIQIGNNVYLGSSTPTTKMKGIYFNSTVPGSPTSTGGMVIFGTSDGKTGLFWSDIWDTLIFSATGDINILAPELINISVGGNENPWILLASSTGVTNAAFTLISDEMDIFASTYAAIQSDVVDEDSYYYFAAGYLEIYSTDQILLDNDNAYIDIDSTVLEIYTTNPILLGDSTLENVYIGTSASTQKIATKGYVDARVRTIYKHAREVTTTNSTNHIDGEFVDIELEANTLYLIDAVIYYIGSSVIDVAMLWKLGGSATWKIGSTYYSIRTGHGVGPSAVSVIDSDYSKAVALNMGDYPQTAYTYGVPGGGSWGTGVNEKFSIRTSSTGTGTLSLIWYCSAGGSTGATLREGSYIILTKTDEIT